MPNSSKPIHYYQYKIDRWEKINSEVIIEKAVSLTVNGETWLTFMCTPIDLDAMAIGFLYNEGLINSPEEIASIRVCKNEENVDVWLYHNVEKPNAWYRTSGCTGGVTSVENKIDLSNSIKPKLYNGALLTPKNITSLIGQLFHSQDVYKVSGGVHTSALSDGDRLYVIAEDIGRHNTLDKIAGRCLIERLSLKRRILLTTGRVSSEMLQKSARLGASTVVSRTSPSSLSIQLADLWGITLIGYTRRDRFRIYSHPERLLAPGIVYETQPQDQVNSE